MIEFILADENLPFSIAITVMIGIAVLEGITTLLGVGLSNMLESLLPSIELPETQMPMDDSHAGSTLSKLLGWLRIGEVPLLMLLVIFLASFGLAGFSVQSISDNLIGTPLPAWIACIPALLITFPVVRTTGGVLGKIMPRDETDAISEASFVGHLATITIGTAKLHSPAEAKLKDNQGTTHYIMVEPEHPEDEFPTHATVLVTQKNGSVFKAIINPNPLLEDEDQ